MTLSKDRIGGVVFLCLSILYGYYVGEIPLLPGDEYEPFNARSLPSTLSMICGGLSIALLLMAERGEGSRLHLAGYHFLLVAKLLLLTVGFALALEYIGFLLSTVLFLLGGYWLLGERRVKVLLLASLPFAVGIWFILTQLLDVYLAPGLWFS